MKKFLFVILLINFILSFHLLLDMDQKKIEENILQAYRDDVHVLSIPTEIDHLDKLDAVEKIEKVMERNSVSFLKQVVTTNTNDEPMITQYVYLKNPQENFFDVDYSGNMLSSYDKTNHMLSTEKLDSSKQIGKIHKLKNNPIIEIKTYRSLIDDERILAGDYSVILENSESDIQQIIMDLEDELSVGIILLEGFHSSGPPITLIPLLVAIPIILLYLATLIIIFYMIFFKQQDFAVKKMLGYSNTKINLDFLKVIFFISVIVLFVSIVGLIILYANSWNDLYTVLLAKTSIIFLIVLIFILIFSLLALGKVDSMNIIQQLKYKKPVGVFKKLSIISKLIFSFIIIIIFALAIDNYQYATAFYKDNIKNWEDTKNYATVPLKYMDMDIHNNIDKFIWETRQMKELWSYTNDLGSIRIWLPQEVKYPEFREEMRRWNGESSLSGYYYGILLDNDYIEININYLKKHPIYNLEGKRVLFNETSNAIYFLIPEKKAHLAEEIVSAMEIYYDNNYTLNGPELSEYLPDLFASERPEFIPIIVRNNQKYFTYDYYAFIENYNNIVDPVAVVRPDKVAFVGDISQNVGYYIRIDDPDHPFDTIKEKVGELGLSAYYNQAYSTYDIVSEAVYRHQQQLGALIASILVTGGMILLLTIYSNIIYLDENKQKNIIKLLNGFSFYKRHWKHLVHLVVLYMILVIAALLLAFFNLNIKLLIVLPLIILILDILVFLIAALLIERKNIKNILNGE